MMPPLGELIADYNLLYSALRTVYFSYSRIYSSLSCYVSPRGVVSYEKGALLSSTSEPLRFESNN